MSTNRASMELMDAIHRATAEQLLDIIANGIPVLDEDGNEVAREKPSAAHLSQAIKFLKDNGIEAVAKQGSPLKELADRLPTFADEEDPADLPTRPFN